VGLVSQSDVLEAQTELAVLATERQELDRDERIVQSELRRLLGRPANSEPVTAPAARLAKAPAAAESAAATALASRPQLQGLRALIGRADKSVALAEREYYPDFEVGLQYGQRDRAPDGMPRDDMISLTVAVNLPIWRKSRLEPMVAEARSMRARAQQMLAQGELETRAQIDEQTATAAQWRSTADTYRESLLPQAQAAAESAFAAYRVGKVDFATLRQAQLRVFELSTRQAQAIAAHNAAVAEIDLLTGRQSAHEAE
jgi:cobalt-zinc-cadmium efflux system outer membrane protein